MKKIVKKSVISTRCNPTTESLAIGNREENRHGYIGELVKLNLIDLEFADYQKDLNVGRVQKIVGKFDINRMRPIDVSYRDGKYWVFDGQHRANAYFFMGYTEIPAIVHYGLTYEDEAYLFARQQEEVGAVNCNHKWKALSEAKDPETMEITRVCRTWGFTVLAKNNKGNNIKCVKTLRDMYKEFGPQKIGTILMCIKDAWNYAEHSSDRAIIEGIGRLARVYPDKFDYNRLTKVLSDTTPKLILRDMEDRHHAVRGESRRAAYQIADLYNKNLVKSRRLNIQELDR
jgi:hypothetical protein